MRLLKLKHIQESLYSAFNFLLRPFGLTLQRLEKMWERNAFAELYESRIRHVPRYSEFPAECIVFSKDRALQLHALLSSCMEKVTPQIPVHVLYHSSTREHETAYEEVVRLFADCGISFIKQDSIKSFRNNFISLLSTVQSEKIFFLVDDVLFIEDVDINDFVQFDTDKFVPTLRMGVNLRQCYALRKKQPLPEFISGITEDRNKIIWKWSQGVCDWAYPVSLDGHLFSTQEITAMIQLIDFSAPNTLEDQLQKFRRFFLPRMGVGYRKSKIVNIPCNKVQTENKNLHGDMHQDDLLKQWQKGFRMDYRNLYGFNNTGVHQEILFEFKKRQIIATHSE